ncbi:hypothetical protein H6P81_002598 [Aristolochia fimbriata]|uniref:Uncharacterized protein n=1 Tax=Aristolochia fimbriata TaxID=158543 RepID=A0AAV7FA77_ARIFI|nr:hypothetical protein H6P81_002598 [Aristolochia fimbriata]
MKISSNQPPIKDLSWANIVRGSTSGEHTTHNDADEFKAKDTNAAQSYLEVNTIITPSNPEFCNPSPSQDIPGLVEDNSTTLNKPTSVYHLDESPTLQVPTLFTDQPHPDESSPLQIQAPYADQPHCTPTKTLSLLKLIPI